MKSQLLLLTRMRNRYLLAADCLVVCLTPLLALWLRTEKLVVLRELALPLAVFTTAMVVLKACTFYATGLYAQYWPYASENELKVLFRATVTALVAEMALFFGVLLPARLIPDAFPRSLPILDAIFTLLAIGGLRLAIRMVTTIGDRKGGDNARRNILIAGAGVAGMMVAKELEQNRHLGFTPAGFVDDDPGKLRKMIHGLQVLGTLDDLPHILRTREFAQVIVAMPTAPGSVVRRVATVCAAAGVESKTIPGLFEILRGTARVDQFRNIQLEDLLRRGTIKTDPERVVALVRNARVMVTGAGGSIGSEIARQVQDAGPAAIILVGHGENSIFAIARELKSRTRSNTRIIAALGDVRDRRRMEQIFALHRPELVFHAAAHKHVGLMQDNVSEAVTNNVLGTRNLLELCERHHTARFVLISTDKAVNPTSVMGATKRVAELLVLDAARRSGRHFVAVRFGNVLGSRGSVVPIFQKQIEQRGPVTVTHPEVRRYFMTIPEAVQLVLQAGTMGAGGETFVLDMGDQIRVADLARDMIRLQGLEEGRDIEIAYTGLLPGEKLSEELFYETDVVEPTIHEKILVCRNSVLRSAAARPDAPFAEDLTLMVDELLSVTLSGNDERIMEHLRRIVPQYRPPASASVPATAALPAAAPAVHPQSAIS